MQQQLFAEDSLIRIVNGRLAIEGVDAEVIAERFGTPLYVTSEQQIRANYRSLYRAFSSRYPKVALLYANKANNSLAVRRILTMEGAGGDCFGLGELAMCLQSGVPPQRLVLNGSNKQRAELEVAIAHGVTINVDQPEELETIAQLARHRGLRASVNIRVLPFTYVEPSTLKPELAEIAADRSHDKWGMDRATVRAVVGRALALDDVSLRGLHMHVSRLRPTEEPFTLAARLIVSCIAELRDVYGWQPEVLDIGGGYAHFRDPESGCPARDHRVASAEEYASAIISALVQELESRRLAQPELWLEPGRHLVSNATVLLTRVGSLKKLPSSDVTWVNVDASTNHCLRTSLQGYRYEIVHTTRGDEPARMIANVTGPTCTIDLLAGQRPLQTVQPGDLLAVLDVGGYAEVLANQFNLIPRPASVLVCGDRVDVVRRRETLTDLFTAQVVPARLM